MNEKRFWKLLYELGVLTQKGKVEWCDTAGEDCFTTLFKSGGVQLEKVYLENAEGIPTPYYEATLLNSKSQPIQTLTSLPDVDDDNPSPSPLRDYFELARFNARRGADVLDGLLAEVHGIAAH